MAHQAKRRVIQVFEDGNYRVSVTRSGHVPPRYGFVIHNVRKDFRTKEEYTIPFVNLRVVIDENGEVDFDDTLDRVDELINKAYDYALAQAKADALRLGLKPTVQCHDTEDEEEDDSIGNHSASTEPRHSNGNHFPENLS